MVVYVVFIFTNKENDDWALIGIADSLDKARGACLDDDYFILEVNLNEFEEKTVNNNLAKYYNRYGNIIKGAMPSDI
jgi:hypothetical protein